MRVLRSFVLAVAVVTVITMPLAAQDYYYPASYPAQELFSAEELDNLVAPIALYPDPILAQLLVAATFSDQLDIAARHVRVFGTTSIDNQPWDVSVRAVSYYPPVLNMMVERPDWAVAIGQAYAVQPGDVMESVQRLRRMAHYQGNLVTTQQQKVIVERQVIHIVPAHPRIVYVPVYQPEVIFYRRAVFYTQVRTGSWTFGVGFPIGGWLLYDCDWYGRRVYYDGWRGKGWRHASRPYIQNINIYINPRYEVVNINRTVVNRTVNYVNLTQNNVVHRNVTYAGYERKLKEVVAREKEHARAPGNSRVAQPRPQEVVQRSAEPQMRAPLPEQRSTPAARTTTAPQTRGVPAPVTRTQPAPAPAPQSRTAAPSARTTPAPAPQGRPASAPPGRPASAPQAAERSNAPSQSRGAATPGTRSAPPQAKAAPASAARTSPPAAKPAPAPAARSTAPSAAKPAAKPAAASSSAPPPQNTKANSGNGAAQSSQRPTKAKNGNGG